jgi:hypothetical protein
MEHNTALNLGYYPSGMNPIHPEQDAQECRNSFGIPLARPGTAVDHAQTVISVMVVCLQAG